MLDRSKLSTEKRNLRSRNLDRLSAIGIVDLLAREDRLVAPAVARERRRIARAVEGAEDRARDGRRVMDSKRVSKRDVVVGIAACGVTPFVRAAVRRARERGARTVFVTCAPEAKGRIEADVIINPHVGPEAVTGSTRLKAGTATKLVLNALTTAAMVRLGKVYGNLMVDLRATNEKLRDRAERIVMEMTKLARGPARRLLRRAGGETKTAIVMHRCGVSARDARRLLDAAGGMLRRALEGHPR